jgi:UDP-N-acetylglucosamine--N-acetylmuramyl-(pentapeptide) pyrophosphoryl-undecaprenol N-acetylglucosamine transferase
MKVLFAGGGTLGPVTPLLAVAEAWKKIDPEVEFVWVGTPRGPERAAVEAAGIRFLSIPVARLTRYPSWEWLTLLFNLFRTVRQSFSILKSERPNLVASAGGFTGVPLTVVASLLKIPTWLHQSDVRPILSGKLAAPFASYITVAFEETKRSFPASKTELIGNPVRPSLMASSREEALGRFALDPARRTVLVFGGGGGSAWLNGMMETIGAELVKDLNVIHVMGPGKLTEDLAALGKNYLAAELLVGEMADAFASADVVVCRAGTGTISELAARRKPAIIIPLPNSPQEDNARVLEEAQAAIVLRQDSITPQEMLEAVRSLIKDEIRQGRLSSAIASVLRTDVAEELVRRLQRIAA